MYCPNCGKEVEADSVFCEYCGYKLVKEKENIICAKCGASNPLIAEFCFNCGGKLQGKGFQFLSKAIQRLRNEGFNIYENVTYNDYFFKYVAKKVGGIPFMEVFIVFAEFSSIDIYSLREFSANCFEYAKKERSSSPFWRGLICIPVAIVDSIDRATSTYIRNEALKHGLVPVVYDLKSSMLYYFEKTPESIHRLLVPEYVVESSAVERPTGIGIVAIFLILGFISSMFSLFGKVPTTLFGEYIFGSSAQIVFIVTAAISAYLAYGFFKLLKLAWIVAMIYFLFGFINSFINTVVTVSLGGEPLVFLSMGFSSIINSVILLYIAGKRDYFKN